MNKTTFPKILEKRHKLPRWLKLLLKILFGIFLFIIVAYMALAFYVNTHKKEILASITAEINENINGKLVAESMDPTFLQGFPRISLRLKNVIVKDSLYNDHKHTLLEANEFNISINSFAFLRGALEIRKIEIEDAKIYLFVDENGYSNSSIFKSKAEKKAEQPDGGSFAEVKNFQLHNVSFVSDNQKGKKLFQFIINDLNGKLKYDSDGWDADIKLDAFAKSLAFNTKHGSFIENKKLNGNFDIRYNEEAENIVISPNDLDIGDDEFNIKGKFNIGKKNSEFSIGIVADGILWKNASNLLSNNISKQLDRFDLEKPIDVTCDIGGDLNSEGDPLIYVKAKIKDNRLHIPDGIVDNCNFTGIFTNEFVKGKGFNDPNSAVKLLNFTGNYKEIPFTVDTAIINDFSKPIASGTFKSQFPLEKLSNAVDKDLLVFSNGTADVSLKFKADIVNLEITKPIFSGLVNIKDGDVTYAPRNLRFKNTNVALDFTEKALLIKNITLQSGKSVVNMEGDIENFLNLYYTDPERIVLNWKVKSPQLHLGEFLGFLGSRKTTRIAKKKTSKSTLSENLNFLFEKSNVAMNVQVDKFFYNKFYATDVKANVLLSETGMFIKNARVNHAGGFMDVNGSLTQGKTLNKFAINALVKNVNIEKFFYAFNNFGMESMSSKNLRGFLYSQANITGSISNDGKLVTNSMNGTIDFDLQKGALVNFEALKSAGKFAFPFRDLDNITFTNLNGKLDITGEKVKIHPMKINSSVLNMDLAGIYSFGKGTNIALDVPLRNPKKDKDITDEELLEERRNRGIVIHLLASDDEDGKVKIKLVSKKTSENAVETNKSE
ncbi:AsmA-like C-terminal region-containing protein [Flavobacterium qiangtangense]|uniref:AsmA-like C-terminal region-containing protein n=1 Tax=Flavobacterium qiangtangense TaxID=1442595 RepID=A0ABW1PN42_9FLAO